MAQKNILIICGEPSGELHAATLVSSLKKIKPELKIFGVGGSMLANSGVELIYNIQDLSVMGLFDVIKKLPKFIALKNLILEKIDHHKLEAVIFVDFSGFNLRLAKAINHKIKTIYYVSPQLWASRPKRVETVKKYIDKMIVLFPFELEFYKKHGFNADLVGHPLLDIVKPAKDKAALLKSLGLSTEKTTISLLPGSRKQEVRRILPIMLKAAEIINKNTPAQFIIAKPHQLDQDIYAKIIRKTVLPVKIVTGDTYSVIAAANFCLICSGTATLETAIMQKPFFLIYKMSWPSFLLYLPQVKLPYIGLANIIAGKKIIPEFIQYQAIPKKIAQETIQILNNPQELEEMRKNLTQIKSQLGEPGAAERAARLIIDFLNK
jgi:lipid-A-disaccharide synthase